MRAEGAIDDAQIEELFRRHAIRHPSIECPTGNRVTKLCVTDGCTRNAPICSSEECGSCFGSHSDCKRVMRRQLTDWLTQQQQDHRDFLRRLIEAEEDTIRTIHRGREQMSASMGIGVPEQHRDVVDRLYGRGNIEGFTPQMARQLWEAAEQQQTNRAEQGRTGPKGRRGVPS